MTFELTPDEVEQAIIEYIKEHYWYNSRDRLYGKFRAVTIQYQTNKRWQSGVPAVRTTLDVEHKKKMEKA